MRELQNLLEGIISTSDDPVINKQEIVAYLGNFRSIREIPALSQLAAATPPPQPDYDLDDTIYDERKELVRALRKCNNNKTRAATYMDMPLSTFYRRLKKYGLF